MSAPVASMRTVAQAAPMDSTAKPSTIRATPSLFGSSLKHARVYEASKLSHESNRPTTGSGIKDRPRSSQEVIVTARIVWASIVSAIVRRTSSGTGESTVSPISASPPAAFRPTSIVAMLTR
jgi:hypothetical protein